MAHMVMPHTLIEYYSTPGVTSTRDIRPGVNITTGYCKIDITVELKTAVTKVIMYNNSTQSGNYTVLGWDATKGFFMANSTAISARWYAAEGQNINLDTKYHIVAIWSASGNSLTINGVTYTTTGAAAGTRYFIYSNVLGLNCYGASIYDSPDNKICDLNPARTSNDETGLISYIVGRFYYIYWENSAWYQQTVNIYTETPWYADENDKPQNEMFEGYPTKALQTPYPDSTWRIESRRNNGIPYHNLLSEVYEQEFVPVDESPYITIYDKRTKQDEFNNNGIILCPTSCIVTETINDKWALDLMHPVDPDGKWRYIEPSAIVKALGQLFTLRKIQHQWRGNSGSVQAAADHIFYQMLDGWVYPGARITGQTGLDVLHAVDTYTDRFPGENQTMYYWTYDSDLDVPAGVDYSKWCPTTEGATPLEFVMGRDGLLAMCGGELYRDNFYYSVKQRMENAEDNVFEIRVGKNLKGITRIVDFSQFCVHFTGYDQYGQWISVSWTDEYAYQFVPHTIIRSKNFNIYVDESSLPEDRDENLIYERSYELLEAEVMAFFNANCAPIVSFKVDIEDVKDNPDFKMFVNLDKLKVGNTGRLYDERLGVDMGLKISQTKTDAITGKVIEVTFGTVQSFTGGQNYPAVLTDLIPVPQGGEIPLRDKNGEALYDSNGEALMERIVI